MVNTRYKTVLDTLTPDQVAKLLLSDPEAMDFLASEVPQDPAKGQSGGVEKGHDGSLERLFGEAQAKEVKAEGAKLPAQPKEATPASIEDILSLLENDALRSPLALPQNVPLTPDAEIKPPSTDIFDGLPKLKPSEEDVFATLPADPAAANFPKDFAKGFWEGVKGIGKELAPVSIGPMATYYGLKNLAGKLMPKDEPTDAEVTELAERVFGTPTGAVSALTEGSRKGTKDYAPRAAAEKSGLADLWTAPEKAKAEEITWGDRLEAIGDAIGTWGFDPVSGTFTKTDSKGGRTISQIKKEKEEAAREKNQEALREALAAFDVASKDFDANLALAKAQMPIALGGNTIYDPADGTYRQTESAIQSILEMQQNAQEAQNKTALSQVLGQLSKRDQMKVLQQGMLAKNSGLDVTPYLLTVAQRMLQEEK